jgi:hypothetical protein
MYVLDGMKPAPGEQQHMAPGKRIDPVALWGVVCAIVVTLGVWLSIFRFCIR